MKSLSYERVSKDEPSNPKSTAMKTLKSAILTLVILIGLLSCYMVFKFDSNYLLKLAADAYESRNYPKARETLTKLKKQSTPQVELYDGYLSRAEHALQSSSTAFKLAYEETQDLNIKHEAAFNLLVNAYTRKDYDYIHNHLKQESSSEGYWHFFSALLLYHQKDYEQAYEQFTLSLNRQYYSSWMQDLWDEKFPKTFEVTHRAHCLIEMGKAEEGRQLLEKYFKTFEGNKEHYSYLMGLSFLKNTDEGTLEDSILDFGLAFVHLKKIDFGKQELKGKKQEISQYFDDLFEEICFSQHYVKLKDMISFAHSLDLLSKKHTSLFLNTLERERKALPKGQFLSLLKTLDQASLLSEQFGSYFSKYCHETLKKMIQDNNTGLLNTIGLPLEQSSHLNEREALQLVHQLESQIERSFTSEEDSFQSTYQLFLFWDQLERHPKRRLHFLQKLITAVEQLWPSNSAKALQFAKAIDQFSRLDQKPIVQQAMLEVLQEVCADLNTPDAQEAYLYFNPLMSR